MNDSENQHVGESSRDAQQTKDPPRTSNSDGNEVDFENKPIGASPQEVATVVDDTVGSSALADVIADYSPGEFNELVDRLTDEYRQAQKRKFWLRIAAMTGSILLVSGLFIGLLQFTLSTDRSGGALIFFAGSLAGYFMRLATDLS